MVHGPKTLGKHFLYRLDIAEREGRLIVETVGNLAVNNLIDKGGDSLGRMVAIEREAASTESAIISKDVSFDCGFGPG